MGTRSLTIIKDDDNKTVICTIYGQWDGYLHGQGKALYEFLNDKKLVNGFGLGVKNQMNGMGCLAAQLIAYLKIGRHDKKEDFDPVGNVYIVPNGSRGGCDEEYLYTVFPSDGKVHVSCWDVYKKKMLFDCEVSEMEPFVQPPEKPRPATLTETMEVVSKKKSAVVAKSRKTKKV